MGTFHNPRCLRRAVLAFLVLGTGAVPVAQSLTNSPGQEPLMEIDVRSSVDKPFGGFKHKPPPEHGKLYALVDIREAESALKLVRPVDERGVVVALHRELLKRGFRMIGPDQKPEIVLTVNYGRGALRNPYLADATVNDIMSDLPIATILGAWPTQLIKEREPGFEDKLQKANFEKLFIRVTAWKYPEKQREKPKELWKTTIIVDDPDNRDLNLVYQQMIEAGAPFFDREIDKEQVEITKKVPEGRVEVGTPKVVEPKPRAP
ncbi:MAG: hypothetical protein JSR48_11000 [Verrucomicrobia bacterium]|nr:hypothetical protein [Verrucomicrobiota bacterium]